MRFWTQKFRVVSKFSLNSLEPYKKAIKGTRNPKFSKLPKFLLKEFEFIPINFAESP